MRPTEQLGHGIALLHACRTMGCAARAFPNKDQLQERRHPGYEEQSICDCASNIIL